MRKLQAHEERVNEIQEDVGSQALFLKQDGSGYFQGWRGDWGSPNRSNSQPNKGNRLTS